MHAHTHYAPSSLQVEYDSLPFQNESSADTGFELITQRCLDGAIGTTEAGALLKQQMLDEGIDGCEEVI